MSFMTSWGRKDASESTKLARLRLSLELPQFDADWFAETDMKPSIGGGATISTVSKVTVLVTGLTALWSLLV